ncbi:MAG: hypothetical protein AB7L41_00495 [Flavobacteriaceae bacterium]
MWRTGIIFIAAYMGGSDVAHDYRPAMLDKPLRDFRMTVDAFAREGKETLGVLNDMRTNEALKAYQRELQKLTDEF